MRVAENTSGGQQPRRTDRLFPWLTDRFKPLESRGAPRRRVWVRQRGAGPSPLPEIDQDHGEKYHNEPSIVKPSASVEHMGEQRKPSEPIKIRGIYDLHNGRRVSIKGLVRRGPGTTPRTAYHIPHIDELTGTPSERRQKINAARFQSLKDTIVERNVLFARGIEVIWATAARRRADYVRQGSHSGMGLIYIDDQTHQISSEVALTRKPGGYPNRFLAEHVVDILEHSMWEYCATRESRTPSADEAEVNDYRRLNELAGLFPAIKDEHVHHPMHQISLIYAGLNTVANTSWGLFEVASPTFEEKYHRSPTKKDLDELYTSAEPLVIAFAAGHINLSNDFLAFLQDDKGVFKSSNFTIVEESTTDPDGVTSVKRKLAIKDEAFQAYEARINAELAKPESQTTNRLDEHTTGCPALAADGVGPQAPLEHDLLKRIKNVIAEIFAWNHAIAREHYDKYLEAA